MRYRLLDAQGDYTLGQPFLVNSPECVAQAVRTRLQMRLAEWFLDTSDGTPWSLVLGKGKAKNPDAYLKRRILSTPGVNSIVSYSAVYDGVSRAYTVTATLDTIYGEASVTAAVTAP